MANLGKCEHLNRLREFSVRGRRWYNNISLECVINVDGNGNRLCRAIIVVWYRVPVIDKAAFAFGRCLINSPSPVAVRFPRQSFTGRLQNDMRSRKLINAHLRVIERARRLHYLSLVVIGCSYTHINIKLISHRTTNRFRISSSSFEIIITSEMINS